MANPTIAELGELIGSLTIVAKSDGFDVTLSDAQIKKYRDALYNAANKRSDGKPSKVRITNLNRIIVPVALKLAWPYLALLIGGGILIGRASK